MKISVRDRNVKVNNVLVEFSLLINFKHCAILCTLANVISLYTWAYNSVQPSSNSSNLERLPLKGLTAGWLRRRVEKTVTT